MTAARIIPPAVRQAQIEAADPDVSAFVSANAGSGKTHVLAQRVINHLLRGVDPAKILCITFTKAAAANMANRVFGTLAAWTTLDDAALDGQIRLATGRPADAAQRARARRLFASALETPGGLKVQTIHAFCTRLLHQFPFEANVGARFTVLDEASTTQLLDRLTLDVLLQAANRPESALGRALTHVIVVAADSTFKEVINEAIDDRDRIAGWIGRTGSIDAAIDELSRTLGVAPGDTVEKVEADYFANSHIPETEWPELIEMLAGGSATDQKQIATLDAARRAIGRERVELYLKVFCTTELEPRKNVITKKLGDRHPDWLARLIREQTRVCSLLERERALATRERTRAVVSIGKEVIDRYAAEKERRALLDYNDLIDRTIDLFSRASAAWVLYKLDLGIDHVLIDEAQDTSPKQWKIISTIVSEFMPGGARGNVKRTVFAVGDEKQSIFSFQGAEPKAFDEMRRLFARRFDHPELGWREVRLHHSFRSGGNVLSSVDQVFGARELYASVTTDESGIPPHESLPGAAPGLVELWPLIAPEKKDDEKEGWDAPFDAEREESPRVLLARRIAAHVKRWTERGRKAGDVLVLVRQRGPLFEAIIRALKHEGVPVAGADRLVLTEHIAVMDLMALADCLLLPEDDLALASLLKSPLIGITEEQLFELAWNRRGSLRTSLRSKRGDPLFGLVDRALDELAQVARNASPFGFFAHVLGAMRGRRKFLARLGPEANDALDELLNLALDYESRETPSLQGFMTWLRAARSDVRRDMEITRDEVRVMTVHGAKGLEANTVILADTTTDPKGAHPPKLMALADGTMAWAQRKQEDVGAIAEARTEAESDARNEYRRLLYVAMTRAAERLIVCGTQGTKKIPDGCWYQLVADALAPDCVSEPADDGEGTVLRYRKFFAAETEPTSEKPPASPSPASLPAWLSRDAEPGIRPTLTITPSTAGDDEPKFVPAGPGRNAALLRGSLTHRLLQSLPDIPLERRLQLARDYLARAGDSLSAEDREEIAAQVMQVLDHPRFHELYAPGSRAEVPIVGRLQIGGRVVAVSGQIDRLAVTPTSVLIGDFKTNRPPPRRIEDVPLSYLRQLSLYRAVLTKLYPGRAVRAALIWTEAPDLMELSDAVLSEALAGLTSA